MMQNIESTRNFIEPKCSLNYTLSIRLSSSGFCVFILNNLNNKFIFFKSLLFDNQFSLLTQVKNIISSDVVFAYPFKKIKIVYCGQRYTLIPAEFYTETAKKDLFTFNHTLSNDEEVCQEPIKGTDIINVYSIPTDIYSFFQQQFPYATIQHQASLLLSDAIKKSIGQEQPEVYVDVQPNFFYANVVANSCLLLSNAYSYANANELVYHIVNLFEQLKLNQYETILSIAGEIKKEGESIAILKKYIQKIQFAACPDFSFIPDFQNIESHIISKYFISCEL